MPEKSKLVAIIGGGPAGMMAALYALKAGARVVLLEKNEKLGKKLYITGKGRCNLSNAAQGEEFLANVPRNPRFLYGALKFLSPEGLRALLAGLGCETVVERGQRVFPLSQKASDVTRTLARAIEAADIRLRSGLRELLPQADGGFILRLQDGEDLRADAVVIASGGLSYPVTGSTGDGYRFAGALGHRVSECFGSLVPVQTEDAWVPALQGLTLKNVALEVKAGKKTVFAQQGELLFTHFGISGPLVLTLSSHIAGMDLKGLSAGIDMKPALSREQLLARLQRDIAQAGKKQLKSILPSLLPGKMADAFPDICDVDFNKQCAQTTQQERGKIADCLKRVPLTLSSLRPVEEAVITRGGVDVKEVSSSTMASKLVPGLYFAGEVLDVDGYTGGFNLQIAFSTGALAGHCAAQSEKEERS